VGVAARADERKKLERLWCYISRPSVSEKRLWLASGGNVHCQLKTPYRNSTTHVIFAPNSKHRALVTLSKRGSSSGYNRNMAEAVISVQIEARKI